MESNWLIELEKIFGQEEVRLDEKTAREKSRDLWPRNLFLSSEKRLPGAIVITGQEYVWQIRQLILWAKKYGKKIIVRGGGSGVCGAANSTHGEIVLETVNMNQIKLLHKPKDGQPGLVMAEAGVFGNQLDNFLKNQGLTCGHYPASLNISTVGGWISTRASGQYSLYFGNIENIVQAVEGINGQAEIVHLSENELTKVFGMEGTTLVITRVWLKVLNIPAHHLFQSFQFTSFSDLVRFFGQLPSLREELESTGAKLYSARTYDFLDFNFISKPHRPDSAKNRWLEKISFFIEKQVSRLGPHLEKLIEFLERRGIAPWTCLIYLTADDPAALAQGLARIEESAKYYCGRLAGPDLARTWHENRFKLNYEKVQKRFRSGLLVDTFDCQPYWNKLMPSYRQLRHQFFQYGLAGAHLGLDRNRPYLYFIFAIPAENKEKYDLVSQEILNLCAKNFISTTHHHGIGKAKRGVTGQLLRHAYGNHWLQLTAIPAKQELDPENILNPYNVFK